MKYILSIISMLLGTALLTPSAVHAQNTNLPLTALGLGVRNTPTHAAISGMGHLTATYSNIYRFNHHNPASLGLLRYTSLSMAGMTRRNVLELDSQSETQWTGQVGYIHIAFPLQNFFNELYREEKSKVRIGAALHLVPFTRTDYSLDVLTDTEEFGRLLSSANGDGESYNAMFSLGANYNNFSFGASAGIFFGNKTIFSRFRYVDVFGSFDSISEEVSSLFGFNWNTGGIYSVILNKEKAKSKNVSNKALQFGATIGGNTEVKAISNQISGITAPGSSMTDTISSISDQEDFFRLPLNYSLGISYTDSERWNFGVNYQAEIWDGTAENYVNQSLQNAYRFSAGVEFTPDKNGFGGYLTKVNYRLGAYTGEDYRLVEGNSLTDRGLTFGLGLPFFLPRQKVSYLDISAEYGQMEVTGDSGILQNYLRLNFGFTINDNTWFYKQKYQ